MGRVAAVLVLLFHAAPLYEQSPARLTGCIVDGGSQPLPGVTVTALAAMREFTALTDEQGCYVLDPLPADQYEVVAQLDGFSPAMRVVRMGADVSVRINSRLSIKAICECISIPLTLHNLWQTSVAVVHLRIEDEILDADEVIVRATPIDVFKRHPDGGPAADRVLFLLRYLPTQANIGPNVYAPGREFLLFFQDWHPGLGLFRLHDDGPRAVPIERTRGVALLFRQEVALNPLLAQLRAWAEELRIRN
jgi:hypothetical protein